MSTHRLLGSESLTLIVTADRLTATLRITPGPLPTMRALLDALKTHGLKNIDDGVLTEALMFPPTEPVDLVLCTGRPPVEGLEAGVEPTRPLADIPAATRSLVDLGQTVGRLVAGVAGKDGLDVFGRSIPYPCRKPAVRLGDSVFAKGDEVISLVAGNLQVQEGTLLVRPFEEEPQLSPTSPVDHPGDLYIAGDVRSAAEIKTGGSLVVGGGVEAQQLVVRGSLKITRGLTGGGFAGAGRSVCIVSRDVHCDSLQGVQLVASGNVHAASRITQSHITCDGQVFVVGGDIASGEVRANGGIACRTLGNETNTPLMVEVGSEHILRRQIVKSERDLDAAKSRALALRESVAPLIKNLKMLSSAERERVTEMLYQANEIESAALDKIKELRDRCTAVPDKAAPEIRVDGVLRQGVVVRFPGVEAVTPSTLTGPLRLVVRPAATGVGVFVVDETTGRTHGLASRPIPRPADTLTEKLKSWPQPPDQQKAA